MSILIFKFMYFHLFLNTHNYIYIFKTFLEIYIIYYNQKKKAFPEVYAIKLINNPL